jgi:hypothetical protein
MRESAANTEPYYYCSARLFVVIAQDKMVIWKEVIAPAFPRTWLSESLIFPLFYDQIPNPDRSVGSLIMIGLHLM